MHHVLVWSAACFRNVYAEFGDVNFQRSHTCVSYESDFISLSTYFLLLSCLDVILKVTLKY